MERCRREEPPAHRPRRRPRICLLAGRVGEAPACVERRQPVAAVVDAVAMGAAPVGASQPPGILVPPVDPGLPATD